MKLPVKENYERFMEKFSRELSLYPNICFYSYGSLDRDDFDIGASDIDGGLIFNSIITPKEEILEISKVLRKLLIAEGIKADFNLLDRQTNQDGRFLSYTKSFTDYIKKNSEIVGPDYVSELRAVDYKSGDLDVASFNFRSLRNFFLFSEYYEWRHNDFPERVVSATRKAVKFPKRLLLLLGDEVVVNREEAQRRLRGVIQNVDWDKFKELNKLTRNPEEHYSRVECFGPAQRLLKDSLEVVEQMVRGYIMLKKPNRREAGYFG